MNTTTAINSNNNNHCWIVAGVCLLVGATEELVFDQAFAGSSPRFLNPEFFAVLTAGIIFLCMERFQQWEEEGGKSTLKKGYQQDTEQYHDDDEASVCSQASSTTAVADIDDVRSVDSKDVQQQQHQRQEQEQICLVEQKKSGRRRPLRRVCVLLRFLVTWSCE